MVINCNCYFADFSLAISQAIGNIYFHGIEYLIPVRICVESQQSCIITANLDMNENDEIVDISKQLLEAYKIEYSKIHNSNNQKKG